ncbi:MAG: hypothetical protein CL678_03075 [Bdellovibrionaceae bacterium]|nr:hypothetical protein [Pseudobdellovibrionaceae bacterium]|tara:strand:+ start:199 stop:1284 length:1086 start_codon:yes stop_codon:yes gene_type:complete
MRIFNLTLTITLMTSLTAHTVPWGKGNKPLRVNSNYSLYFDTLPLDGTRNKNERPWAGWFWPHLNGGIAHRYLQPKTSAFTYKLYNKNELLRMTPEEISTLSPAEKYDIYNQKYTSYPTVMSERRKNAGVRAEWEGICHGWAPAAANHPEPAPVTVVNPDGIEIHFGASDVKALLSYYYARPGYKNSAQIGYKCTAPDSQLNRYANCDQDANAGAFHVMMANELGRWKRSFIADVDRGHEMWNQPISEFHSTIISDQPVRYTKRRFAWRLKKEIARRVHIKTRMIYASEVKPRFYPVVGTFLQKEEYNDYEYILEINPRGEIIGGTWLSEDRPDFAWVRQKAKFTGYWSAIDRIYKKRQDL